MFPPIFSISTSNWTFKIWDKINEITIDGIEVLTKSIDQLTKDENPAWAYIYKSNGDAIGFIPLWSIVLITYCNLSEGATL